MAATWTCPICATHGWGVSHAYVVCFLTEPTGYFRHEAFYFGPGSPCTEANAKTWAETWEREHRLSSWPLSELRAIVKVEPVGAAP